VKIGLGVLIIAFALYSLLGKKPPELKDAGVAWMACCGFAAGILGGAYGINGPPLVIYGAMRRWSPQQFRATLQGYFLPASAIGLIGYWVAGLWVPAVTRYYLVSLPAAVPAILLGKRVNRSLRGAAFLQVVYLILAAIGLVLVIQSVK
jgi:uncharacterized membrane protein YfcA